MFPKLTLAILLAACIGAALLTLRQHRLTMVNDMARLHRQINEDRQATWDYQSRIHKMMNPATLRERVTQMPGIGLVPLTPEPFLTTQVSEHADAQH